MRVSVTSFEEGRRLVCEPAWLRDEACDMAALPRILSEAGEREREREAARESQELGTLLYLTVTREKSLVLAN